MQPSQVKYTLFLLLLLLSSVAARGQSNPFDHRGVQYATQGTDFWLCFPPTHTGFGHHYSRLYVVAERECDVTVTNEQMHYSFTEHVIDRLHATPSQNYIEIPNNINSYIDTIFRDDSYNPIPFSQQPGRLPQARGIHVTSTDTISLYLFVYAVGFSDACNVLPTELLRDEYVISVYPRVESSYSNTPYRSAFTVVATEDSTVVDIILADNDWVGRHPGDTVTVTLNKGELYYVGSAESPVNFPTATQHEPPFLIYNHAFNTTHVYCNTPVDLTGTRVKAHDCKRIAVFESNQDILLPHDYPDYFNPPLSYGSSDYALEQSLPLSFTGTMFLLPNLQYSDTDYMRVVALEDSTVVIITDASRSINNTRRLLIDAYQVDWFQMNIGEGPFYVTASHPVFVKYYSMGCNDFVDNNSGLHSWGDPAVLNIMPVEWWHGGVSHHGTVTDVDQDNNRRTHRPYLHIFTRTADVPSIRVDHYSIDTAFQSISGTPYSYALFNRYSQFNTEGTHTIRSTTGAPFYAIFDSPAYAERLMFNTSQRQPGNSFLYVNDISADSLNPDSIMCMYDPITFRALCERPADSVWWDFGDGTTCAFSHLDIQFSQPQVHTYQDTGRFHITCVFTFDYDSCFTIPPDTLRTSVLLHNHYDSAFSVRLCEGAFTFRNHVFDYTDTHYLTTYWTPSGCDTLWQIDLVTCPHCSYDSDTIPPDQLPFTYNNVIFTHEVHSEFVHIDIGDDCDSIINYTLIVIPYWGEPPIDSVFILAPNVFSPNLSNNNIFQLYCTPHIQEAQVTVYNRLGNIVARFDGLTGHWDGTANGQPCPQGTYVYFVKYIDTKDHSWKTIHGTVSIVY